MNLALKPCPSGATARQPAARRAFTLLEVLLALIVLGVVMVVVHSIFYGALQLRNKVDATFTEAIPLQHTLALIKHDVANLAAPGGTLTGSLQTSPTTSSSSDVSHPGQQCGPTFYTASGAVNELEPWSEMRKVSYYLVSPTNLSTRGMDLVRSVTRNLLPVSEEQYADQRLLSGVNDLTFQFYDGTTWVDAWDSTTASSSATSNSLPQGVRVQLTLVNASGVVSQTPVEMVIPIAVSGVTNSTSTAGGGG